MAVITGSHAYGTPDDKSDLDLVVLVDHRTERILNKHSESQGTIRFGKLNVITVTNPTDYAYWLLATKIMQRSGNKFTKIEAKAILDQFRHALGISDLCQSGPALGADEFELPKGKSEGDVISRAKDQTKKRPKKKSSKKKGR